MTSKGSDECLPQIKNMALSGHGQLSAVRHATCSKNLPAPACPTPQGSIDPDFYVSALGKT